MDASQEELLRRTQLGMRAFVDKCKEDGQTHQIDFDIMERGEIISVTPDGRTVIDLDVDERYKNLVGFLHGAAASTIFDCYTSVAFGQFLPFWTKDMHRQGPPGGVSRNLNVTYLRPAVLPTKIRVVSEVMSHGKGASYVRATMMSPDGKKVYSTCEHHKIQAFKLPESAKITSRL